MSMHYLTEGMRELWESNGQGCGKEEAQYLGISSFPKGSKIILSELFDSYGVLVDPMMPDQTNFPYSLFCGNKDVTVLASGKLLCFCLTS
jgi:hypothetical protein